jgi:hypothetical protein
MHDWLTNKARYPFVCSIVILNIEPNSISRVRVHFTLYLVKLCGTWSMMAVRGRILERSGEQAEGSTVNWDIHVYYQSSIKVNNILHNYTHHFKIFSKRLNTPSYVFINNSDSVVLRSIFPLVLAVSINGCLWDGFSSFEIFMGGTIRWSLFYRLNGWIRWMPFIDKQNTNFYMLIF